MSRIRTFIAVEIGNDIRKNAVALQQRLGKIDPDVNWVDAAGMHVTLLFLGEVDVREIVDVCRAVKEVASREPVFPLRVAGVGAFPNTRRPKVVWAGITDGADALQRLHEGIAEKLLDLGCYRKEERAFTPHLTLGRIKDGGDALMAELPKLMAWNGGLTTIGEVVVFSSELKRDGPEYVRLGGGELRGK